MMDKAEDFAAAAQNELDDAIAHEGTDLAGYRVARADVFARLAQAAATHEAADRLAAVGRRG